MNRNWECLKIVICYFVHWQASSCMSYIVKLPIRLWRRQFWPECSNSLNSKTFWSSCCQRPGHLQKLQITPNYVEWYMEGCNPLGNKLRPTHSFHLSPLVGFEPSSPQTMSHMIAVYSQSTVIMIHIHIRIYALLLPLAGLKAIYQILYLCSFY